MSSTFRRLLLLFVVATVIGTGAWYLLRPQPIPVRVVEVGRGRVEATVVNTRAGTVLAVHRAKIAPPTSGQVIRLPVSEGDRVETGQVLMELWNVDIRAELTLARSETRAAEARAEQSCHRADNAERVARRKTRLLERKVVSEEDVDLAVTDAKAAEAACRASRAEADVARDRIAVKQAALDRTILKAPFAGVIAEVNAELGQVVTPSPPGIATPPAVDLIGTECPYVSAPIDEVDAPSIRIGMPARISLDAFPDRTFEGRVHRIAPYVLDMEKQARTVEVEVTFSCPQVAETLLPGYSADAEIILDVHENVVRVPSEAVIEGPKVLVLDADGVIEERRIETGIVNWEYSEVVSGLSDGDRVVVSVNKDGVVAGARATVEQHGVDAGER
jgi:HlyD family secretion protein